MKRFSQSEWSFLSLMRAGLWDGTFDSDAFREVDWESILTIADQQTMRGVIGEAILRLPHEMLPRKIRATVAASLMSIEDSNNQMNQLLPRMFRKFSRLGVHAWLLKGQGVGACYPNPLRRQSGDVDIYFHHPEDYDKAYAYFSKRVKATSDNPETRTLEFCSNEIYIELHGSIVSLLNRRTKRYFSDFLKAYRPDEGRPEESLGVVLPPRQFDAVFIFLHLVRHYFGGGIGLRQVSDWMRFLHVNKDQLDMGCLADDLKRLGMMKIWKVFASMAVDLLGCPVDSMPFYDERQKKNGAVILRFILDSGNFGQYDERIKSSSSSYFVRRLTAFWGHLQMKLRNFCLFPEESVYGIPSFIKDGMQRTKNPLS